MIRRRAANVFPGIALVLSVLLGVQPALRLGGAGCGACPAMCPMHASGARRSCHDVVGAHGDAGCAFLHGRACGDADAPRPVPGKLGLPSPRVRIAWHPRPTLVAGQPRGDGGRVADPPEPPPPRA